MHRSIFVEPELVSHSHYAYICRSHARKDSANTFKRDCAGPCVTFGDLHDLVGRYENLKRSDSEALAIHFLLFLVSSLMFPISFPIQFQFVAWFPFLLRTIFLFPRTLLLFPLLDV